LTLCGGAKGLPPLGIPRRADFCLPPPFSKGYVVPDRKLHFFEKIVHFTNSGNAFFVRMADDFSPQSVLPGMILNIANFKAHLS
jgi:hypothetical protein